MPIITRRAIGVGKSSPVGKCTVLKTTQPRGAEGSAAKAAGLATWDRPASACLSSRIPYGTPVTIENVRLWDREPLLQTFENDALLAGPVLTHVALMIVPLLGYVLFG